MKITLIDHYDSFTFNVVDWLQRDATVSSIEHLWFDNSSDLSSWKHEDSDLLVLSPGPKTPTEAASTTEIVRRNFGKLPILGICLGHQIIAHAFGSKIVKSGHPRHGMTKKLEIIDASGLFHGCPALEVAVYNSLVVNTLSKSMLEAGFVVTAFDEHGEIAAFECQDLKQPPTAGMQFHPESFMSEQGPRLLQNFLEMSVHWKERKTYRNHFLGL